MRILVFDPGDSTGYTRRGYSGISGGTIVHNLKRIYNMIAYTDCDVIIYETFNLYPGKGKSLTRNDFYAVQVIGTIKAAYLEARQHNDQIYLVGIQPSSKKFSGGLDERWIEYVKKQQEYVSEYKSTEHQKDSYLLLRYFERNIEPKLGQDPTKYLPDTL